ncbi:MAG: ABC transporter ATP-binding protein [Microthrixaceae bacterium]
MDGRADSTLLIASDVHKTYRTASGAVPALNGVDLTLRCGEMVMVMGPSGNGKTTLLNCLSGLDDIDSGSVVVDGIDLAAASDTERADHRARRMGFVFQAFNLVSVFSAAENVELPLILAGLRPREAHRRARGMLERVGLGSRWDHRPAELSGGQQQRVAIARALVAEPAIVWADEPTGNLDSHTAAEVLDLLGEVHDAGQTLVIVTHDEHIGHSGSRLVEVHDGRVTHDGPPDPEANR